MNSLLTACAERGLPCLLIEKPSHTARPARDGVGSDTSCTCVSAPLAPSQVPHTETARILTLLLVPLAVFAFAQSAESIAESFELSEIRARERELMTKPLDLGDLLRMDLDKNGKPPADPNPSPPQPFPRACRSPAPACKRALVPQGVHRSVS